MSNNPLCLHLWLFFFYVIETTVAYSLPVGETGASCHTFYSLHISQVYLETLNVSKLNINIVFLEHKCRTFNIWIYLFLAYINSISQLEIISHWDELMNKKTYKTLNKS